MIDAQNMQEKLGSCALASPGTADGNSGWEPTQTTTSLAPDALDDKIIRLWLHGRPERTITAYSRDIVAFRRFANKPIGEVTLGDLQAFADSLSGSSAYRSRRLSALKSLLTFAAKIGATPVNVGAALRLPQRNDKLAERILTEEQVFSLLAHTRNRRDHALLRMLYSTGLRIAEAVSVRWCDLQPVAEAGVVTVLGKGAKTRTVRLSKGTWAEVTVLRHDAEGNRFVFQGRGLDHIDVSTGWRIIRRSARLARIPLPVSPHWMRHANASHALQRGCDVAVVRDSLGHSTLAVTSRYVHARPGVGTADYLPL